MLSLLLQRPTATTYSTTNNDARFLQKKSGIVMAARHSGSSAVLKIQMWREVRKGSGAPADN
jgi:hypothetical protein